MSETSTRLTIAARDKASGVFRNLGAAMDGTTGRLSRLGSALSRFGGIATALTGVGGTVGMSALIKSSIDAADNVQKLSIRLGASTEALSEYQHVAGLAGVRFETLTMGWQRMTRRVAEAAKGFGEARGALNELGLDAKQLAQLKPEQQFEAITAAMQGVKSESDKVRLAMKLFDSEGVSLIQLMDGGVEGLKKFREEAKSLGLSIDKDMANKSAAANDAILKLHGSFKGFANELTLVVAPALTEFADNVSAAMKRVKEDGFADLLKSMYGFSTTKDRRNAQPLSKEEIALMEELKANPRAVTKDEIERLANLRVAGISGRGRPSMLRSAREDVEALFSRFQNAERKRRESDGATAMLNPVEVVGKRSTNFWQGFNTAAEYANKKFKENFKDAFDWGAKTADETSRAMARAFDDVFIDALEGRLKKFSEYLNDFFKNIAVNMARAFNQQLASQIVGSIGSSFAGSSFGGGGGAGAAPTAGMGKASFGPQKSNVSVSVVNQSGTPVRGKAEVQQTSPNDVIIGVVLDGYQRNKMGLRDAIAGAR